MSGMAMTRTVLGSTRGVRRRAMAAIGLTLVLLGCTWTGVASASAVWGVWSLSNTTVAPGDTVSFVVQVRTWGTLRRMAAPSRCRHRCRPGLPWSRPGERILLHDDRLLGEMQRRGGAGTARRPGRGRDCESGSGGRGRADGEILDERRRCRRGHRRRSRAHLHAAAGVRHRRVRRDGRRERGRRSVDAGRRASVRPAHLGGLQHLDRHKPVPRRAPARGGRKERARRPAAGTDREPDGRDALHRPGAGEHLVDDAQAAVRPDLAGRHGADQAFGVGARALSSSARYRCSTWCRRRTCRHGSGSTCSARSCCSTRR